MGLSAKRCAALSSRLVLHEHGVKQQGQWWGNVCNDDPRIDPQNGSLSTHIPCHGTEEQGAEQIKTHEWGDSRVPVYVRSSFAANICFSFQGRSKNWWRRPMKILVASVKRKKSLNPEMSCRIRYCSANSPTRVYKWILTSSPWRVLFYASSFGGDHGLFQKAVKDK